MMKRLDPKVFSHLTKLETLDLSMNLLEISKCLFADLKELKNLRLDRCQVDTDTEEFIHKNDQLTIR